MLRDDFKVCIAMILAFFVSVIACIYISNNYSFVNGTVCSIKQDLRKPLMSDEYHNGVVKVSYDYNGQEMTATHDSQVWNLNVGDDITLFVNNSSGKSCEVGYLLIPLIVILYSSVYLVCFLIMYFNDKRKLHLHIQETR